jgi:hypothetical protein
MVCVLQIVFHTFDSEGKLFLYVAEPFKWLLRGLRVDEVARRIKIGLQCFSAF